MVSTRPRGRPDRPGAPFRRDRGGGRGGRRSPERTSGSTRRPGARWRVGRSPAPDPHLGVRGGAPTRDGAATPRRREEGRRRGRQPARNEGRSGGAERDTLSRGLGGRGGLLGLWRGRYLLLVLDLSIAGSSSARLARRGFPSPTGSPCDGPDRRPRTEPRVSSSYLSLHPSSVLTQSQLSDSPCDR